MNSIFYSGIFVIMLMTASEARDLWDEIKNCYDAYYYNKVEADSRHAAMEKQCADIKETNDGLCHDECMFRTVYRFIFLRVVKGGSLYGSNIEHGLDHLEQKILRVVGTTRFQDHKDTLKHHFENCTDQQTYGFVMPYNVTQLLIKDAEGKNVCSDILPDKYRTKMLLLVRCLKDNIKCPNPPPPTLKLERESAARI